MEDKVRPNEVNLFGQRFHASVGLTYLGLGLLMGGALHRWFPNAGVWLSPIGLLLLLGGAAWWLFHWRSGRGRAG